MRPSIPRFSEMPGPKVYNLWWGDSTGGKQKGVVQYTLSPNSSRVAPKMFRSYLFNGYRRLSKEAIYWVIPFSLGYGVYAWARSYSDHKNSKAGHIEAMARGEHH